MEPKKTQDVPGCKGKPGSYTRGRGGYCVDFLFPESTTIGELFEITLMV